MSRRGRGVERGALQGGQPGRTADSDSRPAGSMRAGVSASADATGGTSRDGALHRSTPDDETKRNGRRDASERTGRKRERVRRIIAARLIRARLYET